MTLADWAARWGIPAQALAELAALHITPPVPPSRDVESESAVQSLVRLGAARTGVCAFRNNVGVLIDKTGRPVRYGLANDSSAMNSALKSADLIGFRPRLITDAHVGTVLAQFWSRECKRVDWKWRGTPEEQAQLRWATLVNSNGGDARIVNNDGEFDA